MNMTKNTSINSAVSSTLLETGQRRTLGGKRRPGPQYAHPTPCGRARVFAGSGIRCPLSRRGQPRPCTPPLRRHRVGSVLARHCGRRRPRAGVLGRSPRHGQHRRQAIVALRHRRHRPRPGTARGPESFPVFARGHSLPGASKSGPGEIGGTIAPGGTVTVRTGDWLAWRRGRHRGISPEALDDVHYGGPSPGRPRNGGCSIA